jgi:hypothetical protein
MLNTENGKKEASEGDEVLLEGITCAYFISYLFCEIISDSDDFMTVLTDISVSLELSNSVEQSRSREANSTFS